MKPPQTADEYEAWAVEARLREWNENAEPEQSWILAASLIARGLRGEDVRPPCTCCNSIDYLRKCFDNEFEEIERRLHEDTANG